MRRGMLAAAGILCFAMGAIVGTTVPNVSASAPAVRRDDAPATVTVVNQDRDGTWYRALIVQGDRVYEVQGPMGGELPAELKPTAILKK